MVPITLKNSVEPERAEVVGGDSVCHVVQVALTIYLLPVVAIVCLIGGASVVIERAARFVSHRGGPRTGSVEPIHLPVARPMLHRQRRATRVSR